MLTVLEDKYRVARKEHKCNFCDSNIIKGEKYRNQKIVEGFLYEWKSCYRCKHIVEAIFDDGHYVDGWDNTLSQDGFDCFMREHPEYKLLD